ncbi:MAG: ABC transporter permease [Armatimonadetes bacterium]|nr:ABC transporter permease [Armatimonadota bacterium]
MSAQEVRDRGLVLGDRAEGRRRRGRDLLRRLLRHRGAVVGLSVVLTMVVLAAVGPSLSRHDPYAISGDTTFLAPSSRFVLGTDHMGRDILTRIVYGARISLAIGLVASGSAAVVGTAFGLAAGFFGGRVDDVIGRAVDIMLAFPGTVLALMIIVVLEPGLMNVMIAVGFARIPQFVRLVRGQVLALRETDYVSAARALGANSLRIMVRHILPNILAPAMVLATLGIGTAILAAAGLGYLGLGAPPPTPEWGLMLSESRDFMRDAWWTAAFPGLAITITVVAVNVLGDGLRDVLDPRMRGR